jgi:hypothetical protein
MKRFTLVFAAMQLAPFLFSPVRTQVNGNLADAISQLLEYPAPPPPPPKDLAEFLSATEEAAIKTGANDPPDPGDDAPIRVLIYYWERQVRGGMGKQPSEKVSQRLLLACEEGPEFPPYLLNFLPNTPDAHARIKRILDKEQNDCLGPLDSSQQEFRRSLREWLICNSEYLRDELIRDASDALAIPVSRDPDRWIPAISQLIGHTDRNVHYAATLCLARNQARKDALLPLLPWLSDPKWVDGSDEFERRQLAESVGRLKVREALPGLIWMIRNEKGDLRSRAITSLAEMRDSSVVPILREMLWAGTKDQIISSYDLIQALIACGGLTIDETVVALESCAAKADVKGEDYCWDRQREIFASYFGLSFTSDEFDIEVARIVARQEYASEALAEAVVERLESLRKKKPKVAAKLWLIAQQWRFPVVDAAIVEQIAEGSANLDTLLTACERPQDLRANAGGELRELVAAGGYQAGVGAALLGDQSSELDILKGNDRAAQLALLACARMLREPLPVDKTGALLKSTDKLLALAAERYLESEDGAEARNLILGLHQGEALILGARTGFDPKPGESDDLIRWEDSLREDVKKNHADEIFATFEKDQSVGASKDSHKAIVRVLRGKAELCKQKDAMREECRQLTESELQALRELYEEVSFDDLGPIILQDGLSPDRLREFIKLDKSGGRRVYTSELHRLKDYLPCSTKKPHVKLETFFDRLCAIGEFELRYTLKKMCPKKCE